MPERYDKDPRRSGEGRSMQLTATVRIMLSGTIPIISCAVMTANISTETLMPLI
jgi:hypothetical protein